MAFWTKSYTQVLKKHYESVWENNSTALRLDGGRDNQLPEDFSVLQFPPSKTRDMWTYATCGMSSGIKESLVEVHLFSREKDFRQVELLTVIADFHRTTRLGLNHTVNFGRPWVVDSNCDHGLLSLPYLDGPKVESLCYKSRKIQCLWLVPITPSEVAFKKENGVEALESKLEEMQFNYLDPFRKSVV